VRLSTNSLRNPPTPFTRAQFEQARGEVLSRGRWANAVLYLHRHGDALWVVKDFRPRAFALRNTVGRFLVRREARALLRLAGLAGVAQGAFRLDAHALAYRFVPGVTLNQADLGARTPEFFAALEQLLQQVHVRAGILHLDVRNARNVLVSERGEPILLDFQSHLSTRWLPLRARRFAERFDLAGVYKHWARRSPETLGEARIQLLAEMNRWRRLWIFRGYLGVRKSQPSRAPR
jgi:RIO-like serine/threonine protein kinase